MLPAYRYFRRTDPTGNPIQILPSRVAVHLYKANKLLLSCNEIVNLLLNIFKPHEVTALTFKMIEKRCQAAKLTTAAAVRAMIQLLAMGWRI